MFKNTKKNTKTYLGKQKGMGCTKCPAEYTLNVRGNVRKSKKRIKRNIM